MRYLPLLIASLLAGCHSAPLFPPAPDPVESKPAAPRSSTGLSFELVNSKKAVGHRDFSNAKKVLPDICAGMQEDFYCGCAYIKTVVNFASCHFVPRKNPIRAGRIEWEHVVPAWVLGQALCRNRFPLEKLIQKQFFVLLNVAQPPPQTHLHRSAAGTLLLRSPTWPVASRPTHHPEGSLQSVSRPRVCGTA